MYVILFTFATLMQIITSSEVNFSTESCQELVNEYGYQLVTSDVQDAQLISYLLKTCINEKVIGHSKYRFSQSQEYFVPNKTLHKDFIEFIKVEV